MSKRRNLREEKKDYTTLPSTYDTPDGIDPLQFEKPKLKFPVSTVIFILVFMIAGGVCLTIGTLISAGVFGEKYEDRSWPLLILGAIMFIPGGYYGWIVLGVLFGRAGYTLEDIPVI